MAPGGEEGSAPRRGGPRPDRRSDAAVDRVWFIEIYETNVNLIYRYLVRRSGPDIAEDLTAQTFMEAWRTRDRYDPDRGSVSAWLHGIAVNLMRHHWRAERRRLAAYARTVPDPDPVPTDGAVVDQVAAQQQWTDVAAAMAQLSGPDRDILTLACWQDLSYGEIAAALTLPIGTVRSRLHRARARLASAMAEDPEPGG